MNVLYYVLVVAAVLFGASWLNSSDSQLYISSINVALSSELQHCTNIALALQYQHFLSRLAFRPKKQRKYKYVEETDAEVNYTHLFHKKTENNNGDPSANYMHDQSLANPGLSPLASKL